MIELLIKGKLPFVDGVPDDGQQRIDWIKNGERLCGASTKTSNDGSYNRPTVSVQLNVAALDEEHDTSVDKINEVIGSVNIIKETLDHLGDQNIIDQVNLNTHDIQELTQHVVDVENATSGVLYLTEQIQKQLGHRDIDDNSDRTIYDDIFWMKKEVGAYPGFDLNGNLVPSSTGSGLKYRFNAVNQLASRNQQRIIELENKWIASDVGQLTSDLDDMRYELGRKNQATGIPVYTRLQVIESRLAGDDGSTDEIKQKIDFDNVVPIAQRVSLVETNLVSLTNTINRPTTGILARVEKIEGQIGTVDQPYTILHDVAKNSRDIAGLNVLIGEDGSSGIRGEIVLINGAIGTGSEPNTINGRLQTLQTASGQMSLELADVVDRVGDSNSGLVAANILMSTDMYGSSTGATQFERDGVKKTARDTAAALPSKLDRPLDTGRWYFENGGWKLASNIMIAVEKKDFKLDVAETETIIPFVDFNQTVANGVIFEGGLMRFTDSGRVQAQIEVEIGGLLDTDNYEVSIAHIRDGQPTVYTPLQEFTLRSGSKRLYTRDWLYMISAGDKVSISVKALDTDSAKLVDIKHISSVIVPV
ncbi:Wac [Aeromonas phage Asfd_1]|nr:Wac [Aeromonas phage Asfd_1]